MTRRFVFGLMIVSGVWLAVRTSAQTPPGQTAPAQQPTFRSRIDSVSVDVTVTDKQGRPVSDLKEGDFEIRENKQVQKLDAFQYIQIDDLADVPPMRDILSESDQDRELRRPGTRLIVIFLDDYHVRRLNSMRVRQQLAFFVKQLGGNDLVSVMMPLTPASALGFSYNHDATEQVVAAFDGRKYDYTVRNPLEAQYQFLPVDQIEQIRNSLVMSSLESVCTYLGAVRDGRKMILFVSEGLNSSVPVGMSMGGRVAGGNNPALSNNALDMQSSFTRIYQAAARANTSITTFDPRGLASSEGDPSDPRGMQQGHDMLLESTDQLRNLANQTDGRAIVGTNDPGPGLQQMVRDLSAYYLLGYTPTTAIHDGKFHEIQVKVNRRDVEVHARKGYWARTEDEVAKANAPPKPAMPRDVDAALNTLTNSGDMATRRLVRAWMGAAPTATGKATVTFVWETTSATLPAEPADRVDHVTVTATSIYGDTLFTGKVAADPQAARPTGSVTFEAPLGAVRARIVAENAKGLRLDDQEETLDIPDFKSPKPVISPPVIYRARTARDIQQLRATTTAMPAVTREFSRTERLLMRFQVYGPPGVPAAVTMQLLNQQGSVMAALPSPTATTNNGYEAEVGLGPLPVGTYLIEVDADFGGDKARTLVAIRVTG